MIDVASGRQHRHTPERVPARSTVHRLAFSPSDILARGLTGVTLGDQRLGFREFSADGRSTRYVVPVPFDAGVRIESTHILPVPFATRVAGAWLVATLDPAPRGGLRLYRYSPPRRTIMALDRLHTLVARGSAFSGPAFAADAGAVVWSGAYPPARPDEPVGQGCDDPSHRLQTPAGQLPPFPKSPGWYWRVHEVTLGPQGIDAIAGRMRNPTDLETRLCDRPWQGLERLSLRAGRWSVTARGVVSMSVATDGRVAQANGNIAAWRLLYGFSERVKARWATLTRPGARAINLPRGTLRVLFSPSAPIAP